MNLLLFICLTILQISANKILLCYYKQETPTRYDILMGNEEFAKLNLGDAYFEMDNIDPNLCTHMAYYELDLSITTKEINIDEQFSDVDNGHEKFTDLKTKNPQLKVLIVLSLTMSYIWDEMEIELMSNSSHITSLAAAVLDFVQRYNFDGVILNFYPIIKDNFGFNHLVSALKIAFKPHGFILAVAAERREDQPNDGDDVASLSRDLDFLVLHSFGFNNPIEDPLIADHHSPLYSRSSSDSNNKTIDFIVNYWIDKGYPSEKIILGISTLGYTWSLTTNDTITPPVPAFGPGLAQKYTNFGLWMSYLEICLAVQNEGWQIFQEDQIGSYAVSPVGDDNRIWASFDSQKMAIIKSEYILAKKLGGAIVWDVGYEDFGNKCGAGPNPMITAIRNILIGNADNL